MNMSESGEKSLKSRSIFVAKLFLMVTAPWCLLLYVDNADAEVEPTALEYGRFDYEGRQLNHFCGGEGSPTLILEAPSGVSNEEAFARVLPDLLSRSRVCAYERAGYGGSDVLAPGVVQTVEDYADELLTFLETEGISPPYVFLGFSFGGFVARYFAGHHPEDVIGMILIDSPHVDWLRQMKAEMTADDWSKVEDIMQWFLDNRGHDVWSSQFEVEAAPALPSDLPLIVITRGQDHERMRLSGISEPGFRIYNDVHFRLSPELLTLSEHAVPMTAEESDHMIPDSEPEVVLDAVDQMLHMVQQ